MFIITERYLQVLTDGGLGSGSQAGHQTGKQRSFDQDLGPRKDYGLAQPRPHITNKLMLTLTNVVQ